MAEVGKTSGLVKRNGILYCRFRYPPDVARRLGRAEFKRSLQTGSHAEALKHFPAVRAEFDAEVLAARRPSGIQRTARQEPFVTWPDHFPSPLTEDLALHLAFDHFRSELRELDREQLPPRSSNEWQLYVQNVEGDLAALADPDPDRGCDAAGLAATVLHKHQLSADPSSPEGQLLRAYLLRSMIQIGRWRHARLRGDYRDVIEDGLFASYRASRSISHPTQEAARQPSSGKMLDTDIVDLWAEERDPVEKGIYDHRSAAQWLYKRVGRKPVDQLTEDDFRQFKSKLLEEGKSPANIRQKLSRLSTLMQWASVNGHIGPNPVKGVTIKVTKSAKNKRLPFDAPALKAIFSSPVFTNGERPKRLAGEAAYWLPLLGLFTGARLEELGQLRVEDIAERTYVDANGGERSAWFIHLREDEKDGLTLKNDASERRVPVHPELVRLGFVDLVKSANKADQLWLFPLLRANKFGRRTAKWGEHWSEYRRTVCGVTDRRMVFHSFRHTFKDYARSARIEEGIQRQLMGHTGRDIADHYGSGYDDHTLVEAVSLYKVPGLQLPGPQVKSAAA